MARTPDLGGRSKDDLLAIVKGERQRSLGFDNDPELLFARTESLDYYKGLMPDLDQHVRPGRSKAHSTDVADTVDTIVPELMEMFVGGDDVVSFNPQNADDMDAAQQETDYLHNVVFSQNNGFLTIHAFVKDALLTKTGLVTWWWEDRPPVENEVFEGKTAVEVGLAAQDGELIDLKFDGEPVSADWKPSPEVLEAARTQPLFSFEMAREGPDGRPLMAPIAPEDFACARDTVWLTESTYCAYRSRKRAQVLKADGHDADIIDSLPAYGVETDEREKLARDTAGEHLFVTGEAGSPDYDLRTVEIVTHFVRLLGARGALETWRVVTGGGETILIDAEKVDRVRVAAITPNIITHRFYGRSIADVMLEIARIKTSVLRMAMDHGYFALNQRQAVDMTKANEFTLSDLLDNRPGRPVRVKGEGAITPLASAGAPYDFFAALEYLSTMGEGRSGAIRNAQGLNPDTLHDTAAGAQQMLSESMKKIRFIGRIFAETGFKDLFLGLHALIREHASQPVQARLRGTWVPVDPTTWAERNDLTVEIGVGSGGRMAKQAALHAVIADQKDIALQPGGAQYVTPLNQYRARMDLARVMGLKGAEQYYTDPASVQPAPPQPSPDLLRIQADQQSAEANRQTQLQVEGIKAETEQRRLLAAHVEQRDKIASDDRFRQAQLVASDRDAERRHELALESLRANTATKVHDTNTRADTTLQVAEIGAETKARSDLTGLAVQRLESADVAEESRRDRAHMVGAAALAHLADHHAAEADRAHEGSMTAMHHELGEKAADAAVERAPERAPKSEGA